jgi:hypothetical protein
MRIVMILLVLLLSGCGTLETFEKLTPHSAILDLCEYSDNSLCRPRPGCTPYCRACATQRCNECCWDDPGCCGDCDWEAEYWTCYQHCCTDLE